MKSGIKKDEYSMVECYNVVPDEMSGLFLG